MILKLGFLYLPRIYKVKLPCVKGVGVFGGRGEEIQELTRLSLD
jgi:hypothetical protein